jgi:hypothetical protein
MDDNTKEPLISEQPNSPSQEWKLSLDPFISKKKAYDEIKKIKSKRQRRFYLKQNAMIEQFEQISFGNIPDKSEKYGKICVI